MVLASATKSMPVTFIMQCPHTLATPEHNLPGTQKCSVEITLHVQRTSALHTQLATTVLATPALDDPALPSPVPQPLPQPLMASRSTCTHEPSSSPPYSSAAFAARLMMPTTSPMSRRHGAQAFYTLCSNPTELRWTAPSPQRVFS